MESGRDYAAWNATRWSHAVPDIPPAAALLAVRFMRVAEQLARTQLDALKPWKQQGVASVDDFRTLAMIRLAGSKGVRLTTIAAALESTNGTISHRLTRLERHGWIARIPDSNDRRSHLVAVVASRVVQVDDMYRALVENHNDFFAALDVAAEEAMIEGLALLLPATPKDLEESSPSLPASPGAESSRSAD